MLRRNNTPHVCNCAHVPWRMKGISKGRFKKHREAVRVLRTASCPLGTIHALGKRAHQPARKLASVVFRALQGWEGKVRLKSYRNLRKDQKHKAPVCMCSFALLCNLKAFAGWNVALANSKNIVYHGALCDPSFRALQIRKGKTNENVAFRIRKASGSSGMKALKRCNRMEWRKINCSKSAKGKTLRNVRQIRKKLCARDSLHGPQA